MKKFDQNASQKFASFVFIVLMLCSVFSGVISTDSILDSDKPVIRASASTSNGIVINEIMSNQVAEDSCVQTGVVAV